MAQLPSSKILWLSLLSIFIFFAGSFIFKGKKELYQTRYDWDKKQQINKKLKIQTIKFSHNFLNIKKPVNFKPNNSLIYKLKDEKGTYYFRYIYALETDSTVEFRNLIWLTDVPECFSGEINMTSYKIPLNQEGKTTAITIGDEWMYFNEAKYLRILISSETSVVFRGNNSDLFNIPIEANYRYNINDIINLTKTVNLADYYILFFDGKCEKMGYFELVKKLQLVLDNLSKKNPKKIIWITYPEIKKSKDFICHKKYNKAINSLHNQRLIIVNSNSILKGDLKQYLMPDGRYLNKRAYQEIANSIADEIND